MESVKEHLNYLPDYFGPSKDHRIDLHEIMNFDDLRSIFCFCPVFRILLNCPFFEKRKNRSYPTIDHFFPLLSPPPHGSITKKQKHARWWRYFCSKCEKSSQNTEFLLISCVVLMISAILPQMLHKCYGIEVE